MIVSIMTVCGVHGSALENARLYRVQKIRKVAVLIYENNVRGPSLVMSIAINLADLVKKM